jgi:threonine aldolase
MANEIALRLLGDPGDEVIAEELSHILIAELGGPAVHAGLMTRPMPSVAGRFTTDQVRTAARKGDLGHVPTTRIVAIENTHNASGGRVWPLVEVVAMAETCRELGLRLHLDGARLFNAAVASGVEPSAIAGNADTVTICFSKGLGCPLGAIVAGSAERMVRARRYKHQFGGAMRQAGIVAAACVYALDHNVDRLADDHARARRLAEALHEAGVAIDLERVETNFVQLDVGAMGLTPGEATERLAAEGVRVSGTLLPGVLRAVTHLGIGDEDIDRAIEAIPRALGAQSPAMKNAAATAT